MSKLLLGIDDATKVAMRFLRDYAMDQFNMDEMDEIEDLVHIEMEQKSYLAKMGQHDTRRELMSLVMEINPLEIGERISKNELKDWCTDMQIEMQFLLTRIGEEK